MDASTDLDLLLIGKTGNGKSHTGNSILKRKAFVYKANAASVTTDVQSEVSEYKGGIIKVVDVPGIGDTRMDNVEGTELVVNAMEYVIQMHPRGFHAFLLVVRFGGRFTKEDVDTVEMLKKIFGESFVKGFCILVMTCGDGFQNVSEDTGLSFEEWCQNQTDVLKQLLDECCGRIVLFNNYAKDEGEKNAQLDRLIAMVQGLASRGHRYSDDLFQQARDEREKVIIESKKPIISEASTQECSLIMQKLEGANKIEDSNEKLEMLKTLLQRTSKLLEKIREEDKGTHALHDVEENVKNINQTVNKAINVHVKVEKEKEELKKRKAELEAANEKTMKELQEDFNKKMELQNKTMEEKNKLMEEKRKELETNMQKQLDRREKELADMLEKVNSDLSSKTDELNKERKKNESKRVITVRRTITKWCVIC